MAVTVDLLDATGGLAPPVVQWLRDACARAMAAIDLSGEVRIRIVDDGEMAVLHGRYRGEATTTDVLTFDLREGPGPLDTDIIACLDVARGQAGTRPVEHELLLYIVHGLLHCCGHDDHEPAAAAAMHAREDEILRGLGVGPVFHRDGGAP